MTKSYAFISKLATLLKPVRSDQSISKVRLCFVEHVKSQPHPTRNVIGTSNSIPKSLYTGKQNNPPSSLFQSTKNYSWNPNFTFTNFTDSRIVGRICENRFFHSTTSIFQIKKEPVTVTSPSEPLEKPSLWKRFKQMYREYWYVLVPVHIATSVVWFGSFYYMARSGIDIVPLLERIGAPDRIVNSLKESVAGAEAGYVAIAYAMYKIATPARYAVTVGGTTVSIGYLKQWGIIKPAPGTAEIKQIIRVKRSEIQENIKQRKATRLKKKQLRKRMKNNKT